MVHLDSYSKIYFDIDKNDARFVILRFTRFNRFDSRLPVFTTTYGDELAMTRGRGSWDMLKLGNSYILRCSGSRFSPKHQNFVHDGLSVSYLEIK